MGQSNIRGKVCLYNAIPNLRSSTNIARTYMSSTMAYATTLHTAMHYEQVNCTQHLIFSPLLVVTL